MEHKIASNPEELGSHSHGTVFQDLVGAFGELHRPKADSPAQYAWVFGVDYEFELDRFTYPVTIIYVPEQK